MKEYDPITVSDELSISFAVGGTFEVSVNKYHTDPGGNDYLELYIWFDNLCDNTLNRVCGTLVNGSRMIYRLAGDSVYVRPWKN